MRAALSSERPSLPSRPTPPYKASREVLLEVVISDAHGKLVTKIDPSQVTVFEDGVRQEIESFRLVPGHEVRAEVPKEAARPATTAPSAPLTIPRPPANPLRTMNIVCLILNDLTPETRAFAFDAARKLVNKELRPDRAQAGIPVLEQSGAPGQGQRNGVRKSFAGGEQLRLRAVQASPETAAAPR